MTLWRFWFLVAYAVTKPRLCYLFCSINYKNTYLHQEYRLVVFRSFRTNNKRHAKGFKQKCQILNMTLCSYYNLKSKQLRHQRYFFTQLHKQKLPVPMANVSQSFVFGCQPSPLLPLLC